MRLWLMFLFSLLALGCSKSKESKPCLSDKECGGELLCEPISKVCQSICGKPGDCGKGLNCDEDRGVCFSKRARKNQKCLESRKCKRSGECTAVNGECKAMKDEGCQQSEWCKVFGQCTAVDGECKRELLLK